jgi:hypothetical protein
LFTAISKENSLAFCIGNLATINMFIRECQCDCRAKIQQKQQCDKLNVQSLLNKQDNHEHSHNPVIVFTTITFIMHANDALLLLPNDFTFISSKQWM